MGEEKIDATGATGGTGGSVAAPEKFSFNPAQWAVWKKRFVRYMSLSGTNKKNDEDQLNCLIYHMGDRAEDIVLQFEKNLNYEKTLAAFDNYFLPKRNVIFERFKFNSRSQQAEEPFEDFLTDLYKLSETCDYGSLKEELIRDRIVIGLKDKRTSERLQLKEDLQLKDAILIAKQAEAQQKENETLMKHSTAEETINKIRIKENKQGKQSCWFCGGGRHPKDQCPALKVKCFNCGRIGHFASLCRAKYMKRMEEDLQEAAAVFKVPT
ncbi:uncharacterized protein isoform X2 [Choristoneura fumiferana]|uniref:uncharacterized protein isoform X2 n=1 Tax=Choristoneura fumiferana TaxID=7141 RepID=UPI003D15A9D9